MTLNNSQFWHYRNLVVVCSDKVSEIPIDELSSDLNLRDLNEITVKGKVEIGGVDNLALSQATLSPFDLSASLLENEQLRAKGFWVNLQEAGEFLEIHGGVKLEIGLDGWGEDGVLDVSHEDGEMVGGWVDVDGWVLEIWWDRRDELGTGSKEELLEDWERFWSTTLHAGVLVSVLVAKVLVDGVVETGWGEGNANGKQRVHLVRLLSDLMKC